MQEADKCFRELAKESSSKAISILQAKRHENEIQLELVEKLLQKWTFFQNALSYDNFIFKDCYVAPDSSINAEEKIEEKLVIRYAINVHSQLCIEEYNSIIKEIYQEPTEDIASSKKSSKKSTDKVIEYNKKLLHPVEIFALQKSLKALQITNSSRVTLFDIFERNADGTISMQDDTAKIHTLVLYYKGNKQFELLDPSNSEFSAHLVASCNNRFILPDLSIKVHEKKIKLYVPEKEKIGQNYDEFRDCIDIAVKVAFVLLKKQEQLNSKSIYDIPEVKQLSNQQEIDPAYPEFPKGVQYPLRVKQSSAYSDREKCNQVLNKINDSLSEIRKIGFKDIDVTWKKMSDLTDHDQTITWLYRQSKNILDFTASLKKHNEDQAKDLGLTMRMPI